MDASFPPNKWAYFLLVAVGVFMSTVDSSIVNLALPVIMADFTQPITVMEWVVMSYLLTVSALLLTFGRLSDLRGRRWVYCRGFLVFIVGSLLCSVSQSVWLLIAARAFQGIGAAMLMACSPAIIVDVFPPAERGRALGMVGTVVAAGLTTGPALGGYILEYLSWRAIFYINIPIGLAASIAAARALKDGPADVVRREPFDWIGAILLALCLCSALYLISHIQNLMGTPLAAAAVLLLTLLAGAGFIWVEGRTAHPLLDLSLFRIRLFTLPVISATLLFCGLFTIVFLNPFYLLHPAGYTVEQAGLLMMVPFVLLFVISPFSGALADRIGSRLLCSLGMLLLAITLYAFSRLDSSAGNIDLIWRLALTGLGIALFLPPNSAAAMGSVPPSQRGTASGMVASARNFGMVFGVALAGTVFNLVFTHLSGGESLKVFRAELTPYFMAAYSVAMQVGGALVAAGAVLSYLRGRDKPSRR
ncbi:MAG: MFS transporter [Desulfosarcinaceae bacterium]|nr:MFS transporter [Desulfosarcinaceae bacterium]